MTDDVAECLLTVQERGTLLRDDFFERLNSECSIKDPFFSPIKRVQWKSFTDASKKLKVSAKGKSREITVQRDILGLLAAKSQQQNAAINILDKALCYPLALVPLSLATCDGLRRKTAKSKLLNAALTSLIKNDAQFPEVQQSCRIYILDLAAIIRSMMKIPNTCDTYKIRSIKNSERSLHGDSDKFVIRSENVRVPADFKKFLANGDNKERLFELIEKMWVDNKNQLGERVVYFARGHVCLKITQNGSSCEKELATDHD